EATEDEVPDDEADRQVGQEGVDLLLEQLGVQQPQRSSGHPHADGDPQWADHRTAVALLDVLPAEVSPQLALADASADVVERFTETPGRCFRRSLGSL